MNLVIKLAIGIAILVGAIFFSTHHAVYGKCHMTPDGNVCTLIKWEGNK